MQIIYDTSTGQIVAVGNEYSLAEKGIDENNKKVFCVNKDDGLTVISGAIPLVAKDIADDAAVGIIPNTSTYKNGKVTIGVAPDFGGL